MNIKLVNDRNQPLKVSDMRIGEVFYIKGSGKYMRINPNSTWISLGCKLSGDYSEDVAWVVAFNNDFKHLLGYLQLETVVTSTHGMLSLELD